MKTTKVDFVHLKVQFQENNVKVSVFSDVWHQKPIGDFFIPKSSADLVHGIPANIIRSRLKHDFKIEIGNYTVNYAR